MFTKFIEERSFVSETNAYHAFFDECVERAESAAANPDPAADRLVFLELEVSDSDRTVFILPPDIRDARSVSRSKYIPVLVPCLGGVLLTTVVKS